MWRFINLFTVICLIYLNPLRVFHTSGNWQFSTRVWVRWSLLKSPGFFSVFWPILTMLCLDDLPQLISKSPIRCTCPLVTVPSAPIKISITVTFILHGFYSSLATSLYLSLFSFSFRFLSDKSEWKIPLFSMFFFFFFFFWISLGLFVWWRLNYPFVSQNSKELCASHILERIQAFEWYYFFFLFLASVPHQR